MSKLDELKAEIYTWSNGLVLEGESKKDLKDSLVSIHWSLECELDKKKRYYEDIIDSLNVSDD